MAKMEGCGRQRGGVDDDKGNRVGLEGGEGESWLNE